MAHGTDGRKEPLSLPNAFGLRLGGVIRRLDAVRGSSIHPILNYEVLLFGHSLKFLTIPDRHWLLKIGPLPTIPNPAFYLRAISEGSFVIKPVVQEFAL